MSDAVQTSACVAHKLLRICKETATSVAYPAFIASTYCPIHVAIASSGLEFVSFFVEIANRARELLAFPCASFATVDRGCILSNTHSCQIHEAQTVRTIVALFYAKLRGRNHRVPALAAS